jgi:hypothetical protein
MWQSMMCEPSHDICLLQLCVSGAHPGFVTQTDQECREPDYYKRLFDESGRLLDTLQRRKYQPVGSAPRD